MGEATLAAVRSIAGTLEERVAAFVREHRLPGASTGVVVGDELAWVFGYGFADVETRRAHDEHTVFRIASITKTFTATAIMQLRDEGALHLDDPAVAYLPELRGASSPHGAIETVTIRRMLSHESGLMGDPPGARWFHDVYEHRPEVNLGSGELATRIPPNVQQKYSNMAYQLLGEIVGRLDGRPYPDAIRERILAPLGMTSSAFAPVPDEVAARRAVGYRPRWMTDALTPATGLDEFAAAEGGMQSSVHDLARWLSAQFPVEGAPEGHRTVLSDRTLREMQRPRYLEGEAWEEAWCIGWYAMRKGDTVWTQHSGSLPGFITNACFRAKERVGSIVLLNGDGKAEALAMELGGLAVEAVRKAVEPLEAPKVMPAGFGELLGLYGEPDEGLLLRLEWRDGALRMRDPRKPDGDLFFVATEDPDRFTIDWYRRESGEPVEFHRDGAGRVAGVTIGPYTLRRFEPLA